MTSEQTLLRQSISRGDEALKSLLEQTRKDLMLSESELQQSWEREKVAMREDVARIEELIGGTNPQETNQQVEETLEVRYHEVEKFIQDFSSLQQSVQYLQTTLSSLRDSESQLSVKQTSISTEMATLTDDWDVRQQALLHELTMVKEMLAKMTDGSEGDGRSGKRGRRGKNDDDASSLATLRVLCEDEKSLKERVVTNSEVCSDRFVRLSQQLDVLKQTVTDNQVRQEESMKAAEDRHVALINTLSRDIDVLRKSESGSPQPWKAQIQQAVEEWGQEVSKQLQTVMHGKTETFESLQTMIHQESEELRGEMDLAIASSKAEIMEILNVLMESLRNADPDTVCTIEELIANCKIPECFSLLQQLERRVQGLESHV